MPHNVVLDEGHPLACSLHNHGAATLPSDGTDIEGGQYPIALLRSFVRVSVNDLDSGVVVTQNPP